MPTIFVQIASYRDNELGPTIVDLITKAKYPKDLRFGICWQHVPNTGGLGMLFQDRRFRVLSVDYRESKGCCWARSKTQQLYEGEDYTLQIDSHMRFVQDWDLILVDMLQKTNHPKPIISYYPAPYELVNDKAVLSSYTTPQAITINKFESGFVPYFGSMALPPSDKPTLGRFVAAGMLFTIGNFCTEVPYNPNIYFLGEEIDIALRSFTKGYNVFHPHVGVCWHHFIRKGEPRHWEDHSTANVLNGIVKENFVDMTTRGHEMLKKLLWEDNVNLGSYGLGDARTRRDFELFAGVNFKRLLIHPDSNKKQPPITIDNNWETICHPLHQFKSTIKLDMTQIPELDDYEFWYFGIHDKTGNEIYRKDLRDTEYLIHRKDIIEIDTVVDRTPMTWTLWPVSKSKGWQNKITRSL